MRIRDRVVLITGASQGIGAACAQAFRDRGARVALVARSREQLERVSGGDGLVIAGDLLDPEFRRTAVERTLAQYGRIDILVNNAGVGVYIPAHEMPSEPLRAMWELNFFAAADLVRLVVPGMKERREGAIVNVSSIAGKVTLPWFTMYSASKFAISSFTDGLRMELAPWKIRAINVYPGYVRTAFQQNVLAGTPPPLQGWRERWAVTAEQVAEAIAGGVEHDVRTVLIPRSGWALVAIARLFPSFLESRLARIYREMHP